ncbi:hypothetical protein IA57_04190 [Mangrovimonas yunxiaonensis]|uniref:Uncharacterized protein n=1 Tax=Mangrovimonas yunxiaonensis TaxID=1197477 RepID=A0A084TLW3_9FLAO|nr:hypothetical protein [Mangrovimonas yunxiaonensis]KFB01699.1 hypothetical protein IA57_04190 [Mangrovimonas yunxiaonensis]GGH48332.1 hypothetical protein GCM10011364_23830 [Mangrovimonas yunxiaonensis]
MNTIKNISFYIVLGIIITFLGKFLESDFLFKYLKDNIIGLLLTLLAINTATLGLIASKIQDIVVDYPKFDFSSTIKEMKTSLLEQIILICTSVITLLLLDSNKIDFAYKTDIGNVILTTVLIYSVTILWDTGKAVFVVIEELQNMNKNKK